MFRKLLAIAVLGGLLYAAFHFSRSVRHEEDLVATLIFDDATGVSPGTPLVEKGNPIGEVTSVGSVAEKAAVTIAVPLEHRNRIFTDSSFEIAGEPAEIRVLSTISVGAPLANGAVVVARNDNVAKFIAKGGEKLAPHLENAKSKALDMISEYDAEMFRKQLDEWSEQVPEWKAEGKEVFRENLADLDDTVGEIEAALRRIDRNVEADRIREAFNDWVEDADR
jgi:ABC-type transporter Mla subunit MlaD